jgi:hypothetical protein
MRDNETAGQRAIEREGGRGRERDGGREEVRGGSAVGKEGELQVR